MNSNDFDKDQTNASTESDQKDMNREPQKILTDVDRSNHDDMDNILTDVDRSNHDDMDSNLTDVDRLGHNERDNIPTDVDRTNSKDPEPDSNSTAADRGYYTASEKVTPQSDYSMTENHGNGITAEENHMFAGQYAGFWTRFWAYLLDLIVIGSINRMIINPIFRALDIPLAEDGIFSPMAIATAVVFYLYFVLMTKFLGQTLGKMVFGLKVVELDGKALTWGTILFREWIGRFISATIFVLYVVVAFTKRKQGLHDLFADTTVIYEPR
jgi:uncharacterized RDD family membrane protein YckC